jgi:hypothetical protein
MKLDKYYTKPHIAQMLIEHTKKHINNESYLWLEPSAGNGSFYTLLPEPKIGIDIKPERSNIIQQDFFTYNSEQQNIITIGNPPFGKNSSMAVKFFNHAAKFSDIIAFVLPLTFNKDSIINKLSLDFIMIHNHNIPKNSFTFDNKDYDVPCCFQIWKKVSIPRIITTKSLIHDDFFFTSKEYCDISLQRVGVNAGKISYEYDNKSPSSNYFIKFNYYDCPNIFNNIDFNHVKYNTAGNPSISKREIVELYDIIKKIRIS